MSEKMDMEGSEHQNEESQYIGNIWGWKFSWISLGIILFFLLLMGLRYQYLKTTGQWENVQPKVESTTEK